MTLDSTRLRLPSCCPGSRPFPFSWLLVSIAASIFLLSHEHARANDIGFSLQQGAGLLNISSISASAYLNSTGEQAANAIDNDLRTKWAAPGMSQWITLDLGLPQQVSMVRISFTAYQWGRSVDYTLSTSLDGINWTTTTTNARSAPFQQWNEVMLNPVSARYVRVTLNNASLPNNTDPGNSEINEIQTHGSHIPPTRLQAPAITASDYDISTGAVAEYALDGDLRTFWSAPGLHQWITLDLGTIQRVSMARISFTAYQWGRSYAFSVATSLDGISWSDTISAESIPYVQWSEITFTPINARFVRITLNTATLGAADSEINEIELFGVGANTLPAATLTLSWSADLSGNTLGYIVYYGATAETANLEISNIPVNSAGFDPQAPAQQYDPYGELGLLPGDNVCFRLRAYNDSGLSQWSDAVCGGV